MKKLLFTILGGVIFLTACQQEEYLEPEVLQTSIEKNRSLEDLSFPFADVEELDLFKGSHDVIYYEMARKIALVELQGTGFVQDMNWNGFHLSERPVVIYDLKSVPRYYDYIALDSENEPIGTVRVNATKENSSILKGMFSKTFNYNELLSKSSVTKPSFFMDWKGEQFVGLKSKSGKTPTQVVSTETGEAINQGDLKDLKGKEIIDELSENVFPSLLPKDNKAFENIPNYLIENDSIREEIELAKSMDIDFIKKSMELSLVKSEEEAKAFWDSIAEIESEIANATDEEITDTNSKFFGRIFGWLHRAFDFNINTTPFYIKKYSKEEHLTHYRADNGGWCGPWVCGYIVYINQGVDKYDFFESCASSVGEFGVSGFYLRILGRPLTPVEMGWSMPIASEGKIWINPLLHFADLHAYDHIRYRDKPAIRLCSSRSGSKISLHWTLAYGARATGNYLWRNYYFLQVDNGTFYGHRKEKYKDPGGVENYTAVDWWNPWLLVWD